MESSMLIPAKESADVNIKVKTVMICFFDCRGIVHRELAPTSGISTEKFYHQVLDRLGQRVHRVRPELFPDKWVLHQDNASFYTALPTKEFLAQNLSSWNTPLPHQISLHGTSSGFLR
jgi:hypothetical protein